MVPPGWRIAAEIAALLVLASMLLGLFLNWAVG
jgi:hypothetical protein